MMGGRPLDAAYVHPGCLLRSASSHCAGLSAA
jgi:hypothetical protein